jgi:hypothetical protein
MTVGRELRDREDRTASPEERIWCSQPPLGGLTTQMCFLYADDDPLAPREND